MKEMCCSALLILIAVHKKYYFNPPSCVAWQVAMIHGYRTNLLSRLAREMAMICGQKNNYFKPSCVAWEMIMISGHKIYLPSCRVK